MTEPAARFTVSFPTAAEATGGNPEVARGHGFPFSGPAALAGNDTRSQSGQNRIDIPRIRLMRQALDMGFHRFRRNRFREGHPLAFA
jgi:hypothetical protein